MGREISNTSGSLTKTGNGTLTLSGTQDYDTLHVAAGNLNLDNLLGTGGSTLTVDATTNTNISVSQTLAALNIGDGAVVTLGGPALSPAPSFADLSGGAALGAAAVPEPGSLSLLAMGALAFLRRRRRAQVAIIR